MNPGAEGIRVCRAGLAGGGAPDNAESRIPKEDGFIDDPCLPRTEQKRAEESNGAATCPHVSADNGAPAHLPSPVPVEVCT